MKIPLLRNGQQRHSISLQDKSVILIGNMPPLIKKPFDNEDFYSEHLPVKIFQIADKSKSVELLGIKEFPNEGLLCYEIKIHAKGRNYFLYINTETFLLEYWNGRPDEDRSILSKFYNYKRVDGFLIPMSDCLMRNGIVYYWCNKRKVEFNKEIDPEVFVYNIK